MANGNLNLIIVMLIATIVIKKEKERFLMRWNLLKSNFVNIVKVRVELFLLGCSQPAMSVLTYNIF